MMKTKMKTKKTRKPGKILSVISLLAILCLSAFLFTACDDGGKQEIKDNISAKYDELKTVANEATDIVNSTPQYGIQLDQATLEVYQDILKYVADFGQTDMADMDTEELEDLLEEVNEMIDEMKGAKNAIKELVDAVSGYNDSEDDEE